MKKALIFLYGVIAYLLFLGSFIYLVGFLDDLLVPKSINSGETASSVTALLVDTLLLSVFALQHSIMARPAFKAWWTSIVHPAIERSTYVLLSSLALVLIYWQWLPLTAIVWKVENSTLSIIIYAISGLGWLIVLLSTLMISHFELFGLKQVYYNLVNRHPAETPFTVNIFYGIVRHPLMLGFIIAFWATPTMTTGRLLYCVVNTVYILVAVKFLEEKDLQKIHGERYTQYKKQVPMIIPFTKSRRS